MGLAIALCAASFICGCFGGYVAAIKGRPVFEGLIFGAVLGPFGVVAEAGLPAAPDPGPDGDPSSSRPESRRGTISGPEAADDFRVNAADWKLPASRRERPVGGAGAEAGPGPREAGRAAIEPHEAIVGRLDDRTVPESGSSWGVYGRAEQILRCLDKSYDE